MPRLSLVVLLTLVTATVAIAQDRLAVRAGRVLTGTGEAIDGGTIVIENGRIRAIGADVAVPAGFRIVDRKEATIAPGLIDCCSRAGTPNDLSEDEEPIDLASRTIDVFDPHHRDFELLRGAGVTSVVILPDRGNVVGGVGAVVKTGGAEPIVRDDRPLALSLGTAAWRGRDRFPTSLMGAVRALDAALNEARRTPARVATPLTRLLAGEIPAIAWVDEEAQLQRILALQRKHKFELGVLCGTSLRTSIDDLRTSGVRVGLRSIELSANRRAAALPRLLDEAGVEVAFFGETPRVHPESLRLTAHLAVREGMSDSAALAAMTSTAAAMAGVAGRIGRLGVGADADFIVLDGSPVDVSATLIETWIDGRRVHSRRIAREDSR